MWSKSLLILVISLIFLNIICSSSSIKSVSVISKSIPSLPKLLSQITDNEAADFFDKIIEQPVVVSDRISKVPIPSTIVKLEKKGQPSNSLRNIFRSDRSSPIVLLHGFDSSCLEFRRLAPLLCDESPVYVPDILGWGFTNLRNVEAFDPEAKIEHLKCILEQVVRKPCMLVGASLGGGIAMILASRYPNLIKKVVLIDAQGFIDGQGPSDIPDPISKFALGILKSEPLRMYANVISYTDKKFATLDAMRIGRIHCFNEDWERASLKFLKSGGFVFSDKIASVYQKSLVIWGKDDKILDVSNAERLQKALPNADLVYIDACGHVPHLEKASETSLIIKRFLNNN